MDIGNALRRAWREDITIRSIIAQTVKSIYKREISIKSVKIHWKKIIVQTGKPIINSELNLRKEDIKSAVLKKLWWLGIKLSPEIIFIFK